MSHRWMFEVLSDLETYARYNGLPQLANRLSLAAGQAAHELAAAQRTERGEPPLLLPRRAD
ncbi:MAG: hypothetical protein ACU0B9_20580 [Limimaricola soesokkakensis]|uniref:hypothetical protein n=1 Tax=Limimaricola soesokkakensis TaxID=1343159 RepID=UPI0040596F93